MRAREKATELTKQRDQQQKQAKQYQQNLRKSKDRLQKVNERISHLKGPFQKRLDSTLEEMNLKRQVYHKGALVGNDVAKILRTQKIKKIVKVFKPLKVNLCSGDTQVYSHSKTMNKISTLLFKLSMCFNLYSRSSPLCCHEVAFLSVWCASFGSWFPLNFPDASLLRKFHVLTFHVPEKAVLKGTIGMEAEHCSESIHPVVNKLDGVYATTQNVCNRLVLVTKGQWPQSNPTLTNFRQLQQRKGRSAIITPVEE